MFIPKLPAGGRQVQQFRTLRGANEGWPLGRTANSEFMDHPVASAVETALWFMVQLTADGKKIWQVMVDLSGLWRFVSCWMTSCQQPQALSIAYIVLDGNILRFLLIVTGYTIAMYITGYTTGYTIHTGWFIHLATGSLLPLVTAHWLGDIPCYNSSKWWENRGELLASLCETWQLVSKGFLKEIAIFHFQRDCQRSRWRAPQSCRFVFTEYAGGAAAGVAACGAA